MTTHPKDEAGTATLELAILAPALLIVLSLIIGAGRIESTSSAIEQAAAVAARDASLARSGAEARSVAVGSAKRSLQQQNIDCGIPRVDVDARGFATASGAPAVVRVTVICRVPLADLAVPGLPGSRSMRADAVSPLDLYRSR